MDTVSKSKSPKRKSMRRKSPRRKSSKHKRSTKQRKSPCKTEKSHMFKDFLKVATGTIGGIALASIPKLLDQGPKYYELKTKKDIEMAKIDVKKHQKERENIQEELKNLKRSKINKDDHDALKKNYDEIFELYGEALEMLDKAEEDTISQLNKSVRMMEEFEKRALKYSEIMDTMKQEVLQLRHDIKTRKS